MEQEIFGDIRLFGKLTLDLVGDGEYANEVQLSAGPSGVLTINNDSVILTGPLQQSQLPANAEFTTLSVSELIGALKVPVVTATSNYTVIDTDQIVFADGAITVTLPSATYLNKGKVYKIKRVSSVGPVLVKVLNNGTIDGETAISIDAKNASIDVCSDGSNWYII